MKRRILLTIIALGLITGSLSACKSNENNFSTSFKDTTSIESFENYEVSDKLISITESFYNGLRLTQDDYDLLNKTVVLPSDDLTKDIADTEVFYLYQDLYTKPYDLELVNTDSNDVSIIRNGQVELDALIEKVLQNNDSYLAQYNIDTYDNTTESFVIDICKLIKTVIDSELHVSDNIDVVLLNQKLNELKVFAYKGYSYGLYNQQKGILGINMEMLQSKGEEITQEIIGHEIVHLNQSASKTELKEASYIERFGYVYKASDEDINPYNWTWFVESAAESISYQEKRLDTPFVYASEIKTLEFMKMAMFKPGMSLEKTLYSSDINELYEYFGVTEDAEKAEINRMFYAYTIIYNSNAGAEGNIFYQKLKEAGFEVVPGEFSHFEENLKGSAALTLTKMFYKNLNKKILGKEVLVQDVFSVISAFELEVSRELWYQSKYEDLEEFLKTYTQIQDAFFEVLAQSLNVDLSYVKELYYMYNNEINRDKFDISWLSDEENSYLEYITASRVGNKKDAILKVYSDNYEDSFTR